MSATIQDASGNNAEDFITEFTMKRASRKAGQLAIRPEFADCDVEDIEQELILYLLQKVGDYDAARSQRNTFINRMIESGAKELVRARKRHKRHPSDEDGYIRSLSEAVETTDRGFKTLADEIHDADHARRMCNGVPDPFDEVDRRLDMEAAMNAMPDRMRAVADYLMSHNLTETAKHFGLTRRGMEKMRDEIREHLSRFDVL
ncbi:hypothetical protein [Crateriforma spongiae]|uniref:hypothetical protein n=1 Tax=Crateriforma spongiae TaxID=2724528 RepID=UPI0039B0C376